MSNQANILIVDDIPLMRTALIRLLDDLTPRLLRDALNVRTVTFLEAANGKDALRILKERPIEIMFLDLMMPELDGLAVLDAKSQDRNIATVPVIVCSGIGEQETVQQALNLGVYGYIVKPATAKSVEDNVRKALAAV